MIKLFSKKDTMVLDTCVKPEYDNSASSSYHSQTKMLSSCHSRAMTRESRKHECRIESGRSMVEMLGVLAVIGVLSIGGIAGYSYGMDKYRANETINQIMLRAVDLMTQAGNENETLSLSTWENEQTQYSFGEVGLTHDDLIYMDVLGLPKRVCEIIYDGLSDFAVQIDINAVRTDSNATCGDDNEMTFYFEGQYDYTCDPACPEGQYCDNGICFKGGVPEGSYIRLDKECTSNTDCNTDWMGNCAYCLNNRCQASAESNGYSCTIKENNIEGQCNSGQCYPKGCTTNNDCKEPGTYCASTNSSTTERFQSGETGACVKIDFIKKEFDGEIYYISNSTISWWDAEYACDAIGSKQLVEVTDLIEKSTWNGGIDWDEDNVLTPFGQELKTMLVKQRRIWTRGLGRDPNCEFGVSIAGGVDYNFRNNGYNNEYYYANLAICH